MDQLRHKFLLLGLKTKSHYEVAELPNEIILAIRKEIAEINRHGVNADRIIITSDSFYIYIEDRFLDFRLKRIIPTIQEKV
jgi:hypothetical protein